MRQTYSPVPDPGSDPVGTMSVSSVTARASLSRSLSSGFAQVFAKPVFGAFVVLAAFSAWSDGRLGKARSYEERQLVKADVHWFETYCTRDYIAAHPWTAEELAEMQMNFRRRRLSWEEERQ